MRYLAILLVTFALAACSTTSTSRNESNSDLQKGSIDPPLQFLLESAVTDFHTHHPPDPVRFRNVRVGYVLNADGTKKYMLCGQFLPAQTQGESQWTPFATIKTSGYEQWLGAQAAAFCANPSMTWEKNTDLSSTLQSRLDALR